MTKYVAYNNVTEVEFLEEGVCDIYIQENIWFSKKTRQEEIFSPEITPEERVTDNINFAVALMHEYLADNIRAWVTNEQILQDLERMSPFKQLAEVGSIWAMYYLINNMETNNILTQERKDKYLNALATKLV